MNASDFESSIAVRVIQFHYVGRKATTLLTQIDHKSYLYKHKKQEKIVYFLDK